MHVPTVAVASPWYFARTDHWYVERAGWGVAGSTLLVGAALAWWMPAAFAVGVAVVGAVGITSLVNAFTGFCPVSTALKWAGLASRLEEASRPPTCTYRMRTDGWYLDRTIYLVVGLNLTAAAVLAVALSPAWLLFHAFVGAVAVQFSITGFCPVANALYRLGLQPRLG